MHQKINLQEVMNNVLRLWQTGASTRDLLIAAANYRRCDLESQLFKRFEGIIQEGIFKGVRISPPSAHPSVFIPKILGTYEAEIASSVMMLAEKSNIFIDIGCADGYYTSGIAKKTNIKKVVGVDISSEVLKLARESAKKNATEHKCLFLKELASALPHIENDSLIMIDVDGCETKILSELSSYIMSNRLQGINLLVETDFDSSGRTNKQELIKQMTNLGYTIREIISCDPLCTARFSTLARKIYPSYLDQMICALERGDSNQSWIIASTT